MAGNDIVVKGAEDFRLLARNLKEAGDGGLRKDLTVGIRRAVEPAVAEARAAIMAWDSTATSGGGRKRRAQFAAENNRKRASTSFRSTISRAVTVQQNTSLRRAGIRIRVNLQQLPPEQRILPVLIDKGKWRHQTFGHEPYVTQTGTHWFHLVIGRHAPQVRNEIQQAMNRVASKIGAKR